MNTSLLIRPATTEDSNEIAELLIRSIREICGPDYDNDQQLLDEWCANKKPEIIAGWIQNPNLHFLVAEEEGRIAGIATMTVTGELKLCYVHPAYLRRKIGSSLLSALIREALTLGLKVVTLESTRTARAFYLDQGFTEVTGAPSSSRIPGFRMVKNIGITAA